VRRAYGVAVPVALLLAALGGSVLARKSLGPVVAMSHQAERIEATSLHERLRVPNERDEVGRLARVFNALLARLEASFEQQRRFMADASHELRTPVSIMRGEADIALSKEKRSLEDYRGALEVVRAEGRRLSRIVGDLFLLARADAGQQPLAPNELYLDELVSDCVRAVRSLAVRRAVLVHCAMEPPPPAEVDRGDAGPPLYHAYRGDEELLRRLLVNLLDNAIKHAPPDSTVDVDLLSDAFGHRVRVVDHGSGIPPEARAHVFERFFRADAAHARDAESETGGAGLGLAIARWVAEAHGGSLTLVTSRAGETVFEAWLPRKTALPAEQLVEA
jgi:signal transduction histidine kinase